MASAHNPSASIPIEAVPSSSATPAVVQSSPPAKRKELTAEDLGRELRRLDHYLVAVVLLLTFFVASFLANNSDFWMHLATGRLIAQGQYQFGADPFSYTSADSGRPWINHAWLADLLMYGLTEMLGGPESPSAGAVLVAGKALLIVALAGVMLLICRHGPSLWIPVAFVSLAILAMSPRLLLQPRCVSFFFLGLTLYLLQRPRPETSAWPRHLFLIPLLFALWVNLDSWFLLGPVTVALYLLGQVIQQAVASGKPGEPVPHPGEIRQLAIILGAGLIACLLNPFHLRAFTLPEELWTLASVREWLRDDQQLQSYLYSPLKPLLGLNAPGLSYYALVILGFVSFFLAGSLWSWWRLLLWLVFALLSLTLARAIPFFAVVGGVVAAFNWQDFSVQRFGAAPSLDPRWKRWSLLGRTGTLLVGLVLLILAWPGWIKAHPDQARQLQRTQQVAWAIDVDPSLRAAALKLAELRAGHVLTADDHGLNFAPDMANYFAWFCPPEKGFFDYRFPLFRNSISTFMDLRVAVVGSPDGVVRTSTDWPSLFRDRGINHVIVRTQGEAIQLVKRFQANPNLWTMLYADGRTAIFGWTDAQQPAMAERLRSHAVNLNQLAFGPNLGPENRVPEQDQEQGKSPDVPQPVSWWTEYATGPAPRPLAVDQAVLYRTLFENTMRQRETRAQGLASFVLFAQDRFPWLGPGHSALHKFCGLFVDRPRQGYQLTQYLFRAQDTGPSPALVLAIRAGRRAVAANPNDAAAYRELGLTYQRLWENQEARYPYPLLQLLRHIQAVTAYQNALTLKPDDSEVHLNLARIYRHSYVGLHLTRNSQAQPQISFVDVEMEHLKEFLRLMRAAGPVSVTSADGSGPRRETPDEFAKRMEGMERELKQREKEIDLQGRRNNYEVTAANKPPLEKAKTAVALGLVKQALDALSEIPEPLSGEAKELDIRLKLATGQAAALLGGDFSSDEWNNIFLAAAVGDYYTAETLLDQFLHQMQTEFARGLLQGVRIQAFQAGLHPLGLVGMVRMPELYKDQANDWVLWGLLAVEEGETAKAAQRFRQALEVASWPTYRVIALTPLAASAPLEALLLTTSVDRQRTFGPVIPFTTRPLANSYWRVLRQTGHSP
jgi:tetratricopeptide (TPR) repeat protein